MQLLDSLVEEWAKKLKTSEPHLRWHLDEIKDHVHADAQQRIDAGADVPTAFAAAIDTFGPPGELANEFLKSRLRAQTLALRYTAIYVLAFMVLTAAIIVVDKTYYPINVKWVGIGLTSLAVLWAFAMPFVVRSRLERAG